MAYEVLEVVALPLHEEREIHPGIKVDIPTGESIRKEPGETITKAELDKAKQSDDDIKSLIESGAMKEKGE